MSRLIKSFFTTLIFGLLLTACGGGGGDGDTTTIDYTGKTTPAVITEENSDVMAKAALEASEDFAADDFLFRMETESNESPTSISQTLALTQILADHVKRLDISGSSSLPGVTETYTEECYTSGTVNITITVNEETGAFSGSMDFHDCVDIDVTLSGSVSFNGVIDAITLDSIEMTMTFTALTETYGTESYTMNGSIFIAMSNISAYTGQEVTMVMNYTIRNNSTGVVEKLENYRVVATDLGTESRVTISGKFYLPDYGYGVISTTVPMLIRYTDDWPYYGQYIVDGDNSSLRVTCINSAQYTLEVDEDGDGNYEIVTTENW